MFVKTVVLCSSLHVIVTIPYPAYLMCLILFTCHVMSPLVLSCLVGQMNMLPTLLGAILMDRGDRIGWTGVEFFDFMCAEFNYLDFTKTNYFSDCFFSSLPLSFLSPYPSVHPSVHPFE